LIDEREGREMSLVKIGEGIKKVLNIEIVGRDKEWYKVWIVNKEGKGEKWIMCKVEKWRGEDVRLSEEDMGL
jgi:hypothetical protein